MRRTLRIRPEALVILHQRHPNKLRLAAKLGISRATLYRQVGADGGVAVERPIEPSTALVAALWDYFKGELSFDEVFEVVAPADSAETCDEVA